MKSQIIHGSVQHKRLTPVTHEFAYPVYMYMLNLDELNQLDSNIPLFGYNHFAAVSVYDRDYMKNISGSIKEKVSRLLVEEGVKAEISEIRVVTAARYFNYIFNPVSFYFCFDADHHLVCMVAEVNNTFKEKHVYVLTEQLPPPPGYKYHFRARKKFHVSPFFERSGEYEFLVKEVGQRLDMFVNYFQNGGMVLTTHLSGDYTPLNTRSLFWTLLTRPLQAAKTMPRIIYQAAILFFIKKIRFYEKPDPDDPHTLRGMPPWPWERFCMGIILKLFPELNQGSLEFVLPDGKIIRYGQSDCKAEARIIVKRYTFFRKIFFAADIGFGEAYIDGDWSSPDLAALLNLLARNIGQIDSMGKRFPRWQKLFDIISHRQRKNTVARALENISSHYDTSNEFFKQILDSSMVYSSAFFKSDSESLEQAQRNKIDMIIKKAQLKAGEHLLEIGSGWGAFALQAARQTGCRITTTTISKSQFNYVKKLVKEAGLSGKITAVREDYKHITGSYDKIVSIEMLEAVGHEYFSQYFEQINKLLKPGGRAVFQVITIPHERYKTYRRRVDWIQKYIFPGGLLPSFEELEKNIKTYKGLQIIDVENIGRPHYVRTLANWRKNLFEHRAGVEKLGLTQRDFRKWEYYFTYCEAVFNNNRADDLQIVVEKLPT